ncbi:site-specific integrase [Jejudonia soesokkakensis]|uniref:Site-specific integrase n=1 Tax=Jejudonia soesokkakensis TaxID=1323432 RepID=A0ABW2MSD4_9FLAO
MKLNFNVRIVIRKDKEREDGTCPLYLKITKNGKPFLKLSMGESIRKTHWDSKNQKAIGKGYGYFNSHLNRSVIEIEDLIGNLKARGKTPTKENIVSFFKKEDKQCFYKFFDDDFCKNKFPNLSEATKESYLLLRKRLKEFKPNLRLSEINLKLLQEFNYFLIHDKKTGKGGVWNRHKNFRTALKSAFDLKKIDEYPYGNFKLDVPKSKTECLTLQELKKIVDLDLSHDKKLEEAKDMFLFGCYTGLRFGDVKKLCWNNIKNGVIKTIQEKTKYPVQIPVNKGAKSIIAKNVKSKRHRKTIFKKLDNQVVNRRLKVIAEMAEIDRRVYFHLSRHTFGTILGQNQNAFTIMKLMGHKKISTSAIYVNTNINTLKETMKNVRFE